MRRWDFFFLFSIWSRKIRRT